MLRDIPEPQRDEWADRVLDLDDLPPDGAELPRGCVPYLPSSVNTLLRMIEFADIQPDDVFIDIGSGIGRAIALTHFLTGARAIGIEIQSDLVRRARELAVRLNASGVSVVEGDATELASHMAVGSVFFLYCPFGRARLNKVLDDIEQVARTRRVQVCSVDLPLPARPWLTQVAVSGGLEVYRSHG